jgi:hypothetical protein
VIIDPLSSNDRVQRLEVYARSVMLPEPERYAEWAKPGATQARRSRRLSLSRKRRREALHSLRKVFLYCFLANTQAHRDFLLR